YHQFVKPVSPYLTPGDKSSGLLPGIEADGPGDEGAGDKRVQAYNFRLCITDVDDNRVPFAKPVDYDEQLYELLLRNFEAGDMRLPLAISMMPNRKTDVNNNFAVSTDYIGQNYDYPDGDYATREKIIADHENYTKGLMWTLANHPRVPDPIRENMSKWGWAKDEFPKTGHFPHQLYVREARRMVSDFVMTERHLRGEIPTPKSVGMGSYTMDSHHVQRYVTPEGTVRNEGDVQVRLEKPYSIGYDALVPRANECENLVVPICLSSSHIAYGSIRMEPVFMILGQSAAIAATIAIDDGVHVQEVDYEHLRAQLLNEGQILE
ncbi:MAG: FAD-dependent oxidoreductase, partial [Aeoliella sp.]